MEHCTQKNGRKKGLIPRGKVVFETSFQEGKLMGPARDPEPLTAGSPGMVISVISGSEGSPPPDSGRAPPADTPHLCRADGTPMPWRGRAARREV